MNHQNRNFKDKGKFNYMTERQTQFNNNWSVRDRKKQYDALQDKHASYYFIGRSVKHHMKQLKKAVDHDQRNQNQRERLKTLISSKIRFKFPQIKNSGNKIDIYSRDFDNLQYLTRKSSKFSPHRRSINFSINNQANNLKPKKSLNFPDVQSSVNDSRQLSTIQINSKNINRKSYAKNKSSKNQQNQQQILQSELINKKEHNKFIKFLQTKRDLIKKRMNTSKSQLSVRKQQQIEKQNQKNEEDNKRLQKNQNETNKKVQINQQSIEKKQFQNQMK